MRSNRFGRQDLQIQAILEDLQQFQPVPGKPEVLCANSCIQERTSVRKDGAAQQVRSGFLQRQIPSPIPAAVPDSEQGHIA